MRKIFITNNPVAIYHEGVNDADMPKDAIELQPGEFERAMAHAGNGGYLGGADSSGIAILIARDEAVIDDNRVLACSPTQGLVALYALKQITEDHVLEAISQIPDQVQQYTARIGYQRATTWERGSPTMQSMAQLLQLSEEDLDELFAYAVTVQV